MKPVFVVYESYNEILVTTPELEASMLEDWDFVETAEEKKSKSGRCLEEYDRIVYPDPKYSVATSGVSITSSGFRVEG